MKKLIIFLVIVIGLAFGSDYLYHDVYAEKNAKKAYKTSVQKLKSNWINNKKGIELMFERLEKLPFYGQIELQKDNVLSIRINVNSNEDIGTFDLGQNNRGFYSPPDLIEIDSLKGEYHFIGTTEESDFKFVLKLIGLTSQEFEKLTDEIQGINSYMVFWEADVFRIVYIGSPFFGSFEYLTFAPNSVIHHRKFNKLENDIYWGFYESGLYCNYPVFIPN
jgi:hypothetical protein